MQLLRVSEKGVAAVSFQLFFSASASYASGDFL